MRLFSQVALIHDLQVRLQSQDLSKEKEMVNILVFVLMCMRLEIIN